jgi:hypothetical protein
MLVGGGLVFAAADQVPSGPPVRGWNGVGAASGAQPQDLTGNGAVFQLCGIPGSWEPGVLELSEPGAAGYGILGLLWCALALSGRPCGPGVGAAGGRTDTGREKSTP